MKLRQAIKICRLIFDDHGWSRNLRRHPDWKRGTVDKAIAACRRHTRWGKYLDRPSAHSHRRMPYIPDDREMQEQAEITISIFCNLAEELGLAPIEEIDKVREQIFCGE